MRQTLDIKRRYARVVLPKGMLVAWQCVDGRGMSRVVTLGLGGLFVSTPDPAPVGTLVKLLFDVPGGEVRARAIVKNIKPGEGMAVAFIDMGYEDRPVEPARKEVNLSMTLPISCEPPV